MFLLSRENCGYYGNGNSQNLSKYMDPDNSKTVQASLMKLGMRKKWQCGEEVFFAKNFQYPNQYGTYVLQWPTVFQSCRDASSWV